MKGYGNAGTGQVRGGCDTENRQNLVNLEPAEQGDLISFGQEFPRDPPAQGLLLRSHVPTPTEVNMTPAVLADSDKSHKAYASIARVSSSFGTHYLICN